MLDAYDAFTSFAWLLPSKTPFNGDRVHFNGKWGLTLPGFGPLRTFLRLSYSSELFSVASSLVPFRCPCVPLLNFSTSNAKQQEQSYQRKCPTARGSSIDRNEYLNILRISFL